jgi:hypothetical protein
MVCSLCCDQGLSWVEEKVRLIKPQGTRDHSLLFEAAHRRRERILKCDVF